MDNKTIEILSWALALIFIVIIIIVVVFITNRNKTKEKKVEGRDTAGNKKVVSALNRFARANSYKVIAPAVLVRGDKTAQLDAVMIGDFGVLGVKALGYSGEVYGNPNEDEWLQVSGKTRNYFKNPLTEASADVRVIRDALFSAKLKLVPVEVVCVFTNNKTQLAMPRATGHYTLKSFKTLLQKEKYQEDKKIDIDAVEHVLKETIK